MQSDKTCPILEQYLAYLLTIKDRSQNTILEYRMDLLQFFRFVANQRNIAGSSFQFADAVFIRSIQLSDIYSFIAYHQETLHNSPGTRCRKIVSIRQFWKHLKSKAHIIDNNIAEELETPKLPKRIVRYMTLEESVRLLIETGSSSIRDNCIITIFLNCALRLSELAALNVDQVDSDVLTVVGKGNKERKIYLTPAVKQSLSKWLPIRNAMSVGTNALFISRNHQRLTTRSIQNVVKKHIAASGINPVGLSTHKLRHTSATLMYKYGHVDIRSLQQILGHESIATTEIYTHVDDNQLHAAVNANPLAMMFN
ncbi:tyrosine recombinase XerC [Faecalispora jeddahensis]|uniref:tyrosine recombinase XerC n=1 Tax=Faecalispora jeddahensis TaxID=1414721 RepID=UPI00189B506B|nr:tyrosine recombinase XerC [Faecalispora jeddahensis]